MLSFVTQPDCTRSRRRLLLVPLAITIAVVLTASALAAAGDTPDQARSIRAGILMRGDTAQVADSCHVGGCGRNQFWAIRLVRSKIVTLTWRAPRSTSNHELSVLKPGLTDANFERFVSRRSNFAARYAQVSDTTYAGLVRFKVARTGRYVVWLHETCPALCDDRPQPYSFTVRARNAQR